MPRNKFGGKKHKRGKNKQPDDDSNKQITLAEPGQVYAIVRKRVGGSRLAVDCSDDKSRSAIITGKFKKRIWMYPGDILLCDLDAVGNDNACLINHKYRAPDVNVLKERGIINFDNNDIDFESDEDGSEEQLLEESDPILSDEENSNTDDDEDIDDL